MSSFYNSTAALSKSLDRINQQRSSAIIQNAAMRTNAVNQEAQSMNNILSNGIKTYNNQADRNVKMADSIQKARIDEQERQYIANQRVKKEAAEQAQKQKELAIRQAGQAKNWANPLKDKIADYTASKLDTVDQQVMDRKPGPYDKILYGSGNAELDDALTEGILNNGFTEGQKSILQNNGVSIEDVKKAYEWQSKVGDKTLKDNGLSAMINHGGGSEAARLLERNQNRVIDQKAALERYIAGMQKAGASNAQIAAGIKVNGLDKVPNNKLSKREEIQMKSEYAALNKRVQSGTGNTTKSYKSSGKKNSNVTNEIKLLDALEKMGYKKNKGMLASDLGRDGITNYKVNGIPIGDLVKDPYVGQEILATVTAYADKNSNSSLPGFGDQEITTSKMDELAPKLKKILANKGRSKNGVAYSKQNGIKLAEYQREKQRLDNKWAIKQVRTVDEDKVVDRLMKALIKEQKKSTEKTIPKKTTIDKNKNLNEKKSKTYVMDYTGQGGMLPGQLGMENVNQDKDPLEQSLSQKWSIQDQLDQAREINGSKRNVKVGHYGQSSLDILKAKYKSLMNPKIDNTNTAVAIGGTNGTYNEDQDNSSWIDVFRQKANDGVYKENPTTFVENNTNVYKDRQFTKGSIMDTLSQPGVAAELSKKYGSTMTINTIQQWLDALTNPIATKAEKNRAEKLAIELEKIQNELDNRMPR